jgi:ATP-dependent helicase/nuclease subunit B
LRTKTDEYYPSSLIDDLGLEVVLNPSINKEISYSTNQDKMILAKKLDKLIKYDELERDIDILYHNYQDIPYQTYDNSFKGVDNKKLLNHLSPKLRLSYSSIDDYFKCAFKYYVNNVMNFKKREEAFHLTIGNLFHYCLSHAFKPGFDFDMRWNEYLKDIELSSKEEFFLIKLRDELKFVIKTIEAQNKLSTLDNALYEEKIYVDLPNVIDVTFSGVVDKIMYKDSLVSLVDYKTGNTDININNVIYGLNMQLPIYLYLVRNSKKFDSPKFVGFYLQEILHNEIYNDNKNNYEKLKKDALKLKGYSIAEEDTLSQFDSSYKDSLVIRSMKVGNNGFYAYSKILNNNQMNKLINLVGEKIDEGATNILKGNFDVNPKQLGDTNVACQYCELKDICYMKDSDIVTLKEYKNLDFLGGDINE